MTYRQLRVGFDSLRCLADNNLQATPRDIASAASRLKRNGDFAQGHIKTTFYEEINDMEHIVTIKCFSCGKTKDIVVSQPIQFAFEIIQIANEAGMIGWLDFDNQRAVIFCDEKCKNDQMTKRGTVRIHPRHI